MALFLETERLFIRAPQDADFDNWRSVSSEPAEKLRAYMKRCAADFKKHGFSMGTIIDRETGEFAGRAGLYFHFSDTPKQDIELGCFISKPHRNKGYASELTNAMIDWGMKHLRVAKLTAHTPVDLVNSHLVLEHSGMRRLEALLIDGEALYRYEITRDAWIEPVLPAAVPVALAPWR
jgi:RimJ/RimL family protein N-acetyltransferase